MNFIKIRIETTLIILLASSMLATAQSPTANFSSDITSGCFPITVNFIDLSTNTPTSWDWDFGNGNSSNFQNPSAVYLTPGSYTVTLIACNGTGCDTIVRTNYITAFNYPVANFASNITFGCTPLGVTFIDLSIPVSSAITSWYWDFGDGNSSTLTNPTHVYSTPGVYDVSISITDNLGCNDSKSISNYITASSPPTLSYTVDNSYSCVAPMNVNFTNTSTQGTYSVSSWIWNFGDGFFSTTQSPSHNYTSAGSYTISLTATDAIGCQVTLLDSNAIVIGADSASFTSSINRTCSALQVSFFGTANGNISNWDWDFGDGSGIQSGQNISHDYTSSGMWTVTLTTTNVAGCTDSTTRDFTYQQTTGTFIVDTTYACSAPFPVTFSGAASGNPPFTWQWDFSYNSMVGFITESTSQSPSHSYNFEGTFDVMMIVTDAYGCTHSTTLNSFGDSIWVKYPLIYNIYESPSQGCIPLDVDFTEWSIPGMGSIAGWSWDFDDPVSGTNNTSSLPTPTHTYDSIGLYNPSLVITNTLGCTDTATGFVRSGDPRLADSITVPVDTACHGSPVTLIAYSSDTVVNGGQWDYGDGYGGSGWQASTHEFQDTGMLIIEFIPVYNGCPGDTPVYDSIYILPPKPIFTATPTFGCAPPLAVTFTNTSWEADSTSWDFGDGTAFDTTTSPVHTYTIPGRHIAVMTVTNENGCLDEQWMYIYIPQPTAAFSASSTSGCVPHTVNFSELAFDYVSGNQLTWNWDWDFGDGNTSTQRNPSHTYTTAGLFTVSLTVTDNNGCQHILTKTDEIETSLSTADYSATPTTGCEGLTVGFTDLSTQYAPITSWSWDFGDGSPADPNPSPSHVYTSAGSYDIALTITDAIGCINTLTVSSLVDITKPSPTFTHDPKVCISDPTSFVNTTLGSGLSWMWNFDDGDTSSAQNPTHIYTSASSYDVTVTATDTNGCSDSLSSTIQVIGLPVVDFSVDSFFAICPPLIVQFNDLSTSAGDSITNWFWDFGDTTSTTAAEPVHTFIYPSDFDVQLTVTNSTGCTDSTLKPGFISVAGPEGEFFFTPDTGCVPFTVTFTSTTSNVTIFNWDFGNGVVDTVSGGSISHTYLQPGYPIPQLSITDSMGCKLGAISPVPGFLTIGEVVADFELFPDTLYTPFCPNDTVFFTDSSYSLNDSALISAWGWSFGDGYTSTEQNPRHVYTSIGTYSVSLTAYSDVGCSKTLSKTVVVILNDTLVLKATMLDSIPASCFGGSDGEATADGISGTGPYSFSWGTSAGSQTTAIATGLIAGSHSVTVTDANGCTDSISIIINEPPEPSVLINSITDVSCYGFSDGSIDVSGSGGTAPYGYLWDAAAGSQPTPIASGLIAGIYTVTVTDTNGCPFSDSATVNEPSALAISTDSTDVLCFGGATGAATAIPSGGTPGYTFAWDTAATNQTTQTATGLSIGTYSVTVSDLNGCFDSALVQVLEPTLLTSSIDSVSDVSCFGLSDGTISVSGVGGVPPYSYQWDAQASSQTTALATGLITGQYTVVVRDSNGCTTNDTATIAEPTEIVISTTTTDALCNGDSSGSATASAIGGWPSYSYLWDASAGSQTTDTATGLMAGTYQVTVTDSTGCFEIDTATVGQPTTVIGNIDSVTNASCFGFTDGQIAISGTGGTTPYSYLWDAAAGLQTTAIATGLMAGTYTFTVTDSNSCTYSDSAIITEPPLMNITTGFTNTTCFGDTDGTATVTPSGGTSAYSYLWNDSLSQTTATATALPAGTWNVTITDAKNCVVDTLVTISGPPLLTATIIKVNANLCYGDSLGELDALASGGTAPYSYSWFPGSATTPSIINMPAGNYILTVTDSHNCQATDTVSIVEMTPLSLSLDNNGMDTICYFIGHTLDVLASGSAPPYTYSWTNGSNTFGNNPISVMIDAEETWDVTVTDSAGCSSTDAITLYVNYIEVTLDAPDSACYAGTATITATASGTLPGYSSNYSYAWNTTQSSSSVQVPVFGSTSFAVTVTDGCSRSVTESVTIHNYPFPDILIDVGPSPACPGALLTFTDPVNSIPGSTHFWNFGDGNTATGLTVQHSYSTGGVFSPSVTVTSPNGCAKTFTSSNAVTIYASPNAYFEPSRTVAGFENPLIYFENMSWSQDAMESYLWDFGDGTWDTELNTSHSFTEVGIFSVTLTITTVNGCTGQYSMDIRIDPPVIDFQIPTAFTPNPSGSSGGSYDPASFENDVFYPLTDYVEEYLLQVFNRWGELIFESDNLAVGWDGYYRERLSQQDTYIWKLKILWIGGEEYDDVGRVLLIR